MNHSTPDRHKTVNFVHYTWHAGHLPDTSVIIYRSAKTTLTMQMQGKTSPIFASFIQFCSGKGCSMCGHARPPVPFFDDVIISERCLSCLPYPVLPMAGYRLCMHRLPPPQLLRGQWQQWSGEGDSCGCIMFILSDTDWNWYCKFHKVSHLMAA